MLGLYRRIVIYSYGPCHFVLPPQGLIDVEKEVAKLTTKKGEVEKQMEKLEEKMKKSDYREKVPVKVQEQDAEKVREGFVSILLY